jgi:hypothetical protein
MFVVNIESFPFIGVAPCWDPFDRVSQVLTSRRPLFPNRSLPKPAQRRGGSGPVTDTAFPPRPGQSAIRTSAVNHRLRPSQVCCSRKLQCDLCGLLGNLDSEMHLLCCDAMLSIKSEHNEENWSWMAIRICAKDHTSRNLTEVSKEWDVRAVRRRHSFKDYHRPPL